jgi:hypothetical protein
MSADQPTVSNTPGSDDQTLVESPIKKNIPVDSAFVREIITKDRLLSELLGSRQIIMELNICSLANDLVSEAHLTQGMIEINAWIGEMLLNMDENYVDNRLEVHSNLVRRFVTFLQANMDQVFASYLLNPLVFTANSKVAFSAYVYPLEDDKIPFELRRRYFTEVLLPILPPEMLKDLILQVKDSTIKHELYHLAFQILKNNPYIQDFLPSREELDVIYGSIDYANRTEYKQLNPYSDDIESLSAIRMAIKQHRQEAIGTWLDDLPRELKRKYINHMQIRALEENLVRALTEIATGQRNSYEGDFIAYLKGIHGANYYSKVIPGIAKLVNDLVGLNAEEVAHYTQECLLDIDAHSEEVIMNYDNRFKGTAVTDSSDDETYRFEF